jgi:hypothetical protein
MTLLTVSYDKWVPITTAFGVVSLRIEERPLDVDGGCEYIEQAVAHSRQGLVLQLGDFTAWC